MSAGYTPCKVYKLSDDDTGACPFADCDIRSFAWGCEGLVDGYIDACRWHAMESMRDYLASLEESE